MSAAEEIVAGASGGQTAGDPSGWTVDTLSTHLGALIVELDRRYQERFDSQEKAIVAALASAERAVNAALSATEKASLLAEQNNQRWREQANEWRAAMDDREKKFLTRDEYHAAHRSLEGIVQGMKERADKLEGQGVGLSLGASILVGAVGIIGAVIGIVMAVS